MANNEPLYVGVPDPFSLRKGLLNSSKDILNSLKRYEKFELIRKEKNNHTFEIVKIMKEINSLVKKLKETMPRTTARLKEAEKVPVENKIITEKTKLAALESELVKVEEKLRSMEGY